MPPPAVVARTGRAWWLGGDRDQIEEVDEPYWPGKEADEEVEANEQKDPAITSSRSP